MNCCNAQKILDVNVSDIHLEIAISEINRWIKENRKVYICVAPVSTVVYCQRNPEYKKVINRANMVTPDGVPLVWIGKMKKFKKIKRTYGPDLMKALCEKGEEEGYKHYFYGGRQETLQKLINRLKKDFPRIQIAGYLAPPFGDLSELQIREHLKSINASQADILWVGLGSPKQDFWMHQNRDRLNVPVLVGVGAAFDFLSGVKPQAPRWIRNAGLEWLFRLCSEPGRLWKRYLIGNTLFLFYLAKDWFLSIVNRKK